MESFLFNLKRFLDNIDSYRDKILFSFIKPCWPRSIIPNYITYLRVLIGIVLLVILFFLKIDNKALILWLFSIGVITDFIDGPVARGTNKVTEFGAMLDSTSDRILIIPIAVYALLQSNKWLLLILILVEIANGLSALYYKSKEIYLEANIFGKIKMVLMSIVFVVILIVWPKPPSPFYIYLLWATIPLSFLSVLTRFLELKNNGKL